METQALILTILLLVAVAAFVIGVRRGERRNDLGYTVDCRKEEYGFWLWSGYRLYAEIQYTYRGIPVGNPVLHLKQKVDKLDEEAVKQVIEWGMALAAKARVPLAARREAKALEAGKASTVSHKRGRVAVPVDRE